MTHLTMVNKLRIFRRVLEAFRDFQSCNRNPQLVIMSRKFDGYNRILREMIIALQQQHAAAVEFNQAKMKVVRSIAALTQESPISNLFGMGPKGSSHTSVKIQNVSSTDVRSHSYSSIHFSLNSQNKSYLNFFDDSIVGVVSAMEQVTLTRIRVALQESEKLRREVDHYFYKTKRLEKTFMRNKEPTQGLEAALLRNQTKYRNAKRLYEDHSQDLCLLMEEMTDRGWRDLFPILLKLTQSDLYVATFQYEAMSKLRDIIRDLENIGAKFQVSLKSRLDLFQTMSATELSTKHLEMQGMGIATTASNKKFQDDISSFMEMCQSFMEVSTPVQVDDDQDEIRSMGTTFVECATLESKDASLNKDEEPTPSATDNNIEDEDELILAPAPVLAEDEDTTGIVSDPKGDASHANDERYSNDDDNCDDISLSPRPSEA